MSQKILFQKIQKIKLIICNYLDFCQKLLKSFIYVAKKGKIDYNLKKNIFFKY